LVVGVGQQILEDAGAEKASIGDCPTVVDGDQLDRACDAVTKQVYGRGVTVQERSYRSFRRGGAHPREVVWVVVDLDDEPSTAGEVTSATDARPVSSGEDNVDEELEVMSTKLQHRYCSFLSAKVDLPHSGQASPPG
jgi:hypothetical protein